MDTDTVLKIIAMIDARIKSITKQEETDDARGDEMLWYRGGIEALQKLQDHLQKHIDSLQNAVENQTGE